MPKASNIDVREILDGVAPYDVIEILWLDASVTTNTKNKINNKVIATYIRLIAQFIDIVEDSTYGVEHLILATIESHPDNPTIISIPLASVVNVHPIDMERMRIKRVGTIGHPFLTGSYVKVISGRDMTHD